MSNRITVPIGAPYQEGDQFGKRTRSQTCFSSIGLMRFTDAEVRELSDEFGIPVTREVVEEVIVPKVAALTCKECGVRFTCCSQCGGVLLPQPLPAETVELLKNAMYRLRNNGLASRDIEAHLVEHGEESE